MRADRGAFESLHKHMLPADGSKLALQIKRHDKSNHYREHSLLATERRRELDILHGVKDDSAHIPRARHQNGTELYGLKGNNRWEQSQ